MHPQSDSRLRSAHVPLPSDRPLVQGASQLGTQAPERRTPSAPQPDIELIARLQAPATSPRVLVAEDDAEMRRLIVTALRRDGLDVVEARDGLELFAAIEAASRVPRRPAPPLSLVVTDVRMPGLSGLDGLWILRTGGWQVPVILITAFSDAATRAEAQRLDAFAVLDKPFALEDLQLCARAALRSGRDRTGA
jgi:CheY-like chemotaxis protein